MAVQKSAGRYQAVAAHQHRSGTDPAVSAAYKRPVDPDSIIRHLMRDINLAGGGPGWASIAPNAPTMAKSSFLATARALAAQTPLGRSAKRVVKAAERGESAQAAVAAGYRKYAKEGGRLDYGAWTRAVVGGRA